jgi:hypothetical protein
MRIEKVLIPAVVERGQCLRPDEMSLLQQGSATCKRLRIDATELAQPQAICHKMLDLLVVPTAQAPHPKRLTTTCWMRCRSGYSLRIIFAGGYDTL